MDRFCWKDRFVCLCVIVNTMKGRRDMSVNEVIDLVLHKADERGYWYCWHPELISAVEHSKLREDALIACGTYGPIMKWEGPAPKDQGQLQLPF